MIDFKNEKILNNLGFVAMGFTIAASLFANFVGVKQRDLTIEKKVEEAVAKLK